MSPGLISRSPDVRIKKGINAQQIRNRSRTKHYENAGGEISDTGASNVQQQQQTQFFYQTQGPSQSNTGGNSGTPQRSNFQQYHGSKGDPGKDSRLP
jgi:hypothetical protein